MPNRYVREDAIESEAVNRLSWHAEVFWRRLLNRVDDFGRIEAHPALLRAKLFPLQLAKVSEEDVTRLQAECEQAGLLASYTAEGKRFLAMRKWEKGRAKTSKHPDPPPEIEESLRTHVYTCKHVQTDPPDTEPDPDTDTDYDTEPDQRASEGPDLVGLVESQNGKVVGSGCQLAELYELCSKQAQGPEKLLIVQQKAREFHAEMERDGWRIDGQSVSNPAGLFLNRMVRAGLLPRKRIA